MMRWRRQLTLAAILAVPGIFLAVRGVFGAPLVLLFGVIIVAADYLIAQESWRVPEPWPSVPLRFRGGARTELAQLAWVMVNREGFVDRGVLERVRALAQKELAQHGVSWTGTPGTPMSPAPLATQLLGPGAIATLNSTTDVRPRALENVVTRLEQIRKR